MDYSTIKSEEIVGMALCIAKTLTANKTSEEIKKIMRIICIIQDDITLILDEKNTTKK